MPQYNTTQEFSFLERDESVPIITTVSAGSLIISTWDGAQYVVADTITSTGAKELFVKGQGMKFEPTGDMVYSVKAGS
ncbi:MAG TPA: hypothetical protein EYN67_15975 [Flavobacteriales bacterium]|nr:hypothetical protein [Flavobacteriales bacterium]